MGIKSTKTNAIRSPTVKSHLLLAILMGVIVTFGWQLLPALINILWGVTLRSVVIVVNAELSLIIGGWLAGWVANQRKILAGFLAGIVGVSLKIAEHFINGHKDVGTFAALIINYTIVSILGALVAVWLRSRRQNSTVKASDHHSRLKPWLFAGAVIFIIALAAFGLFYLGKTSKNAPVIIPNPTITTSLNPKALPTQKPTYTIQSSPTILPTQNQSTPITITASFTAEPADVEAILTKCTEQWQSCWSMSYSDATWTGLQVGTVGATYFGNHFTIQRLLLYFDTKSIPENATISHVVLHLHIGNYLNGDPTFDVVQSTAQLSPTIADFSHTGNISGGIIKPAHGNMWLEITLTDSSLGWIMPGGTTRLALRNDLDLRNISPTKPNDALISLYESGQYAPYLDVTYSIP